MNEREKLLYLLVDLELQVSKIYARFAEWFPEDAPLWKQMEAEEIQHAALIDDERELLLTSAWFADDMIDSNTMLIQTILRRVKEVAVALQERPTTRLGALTTAIQMEESAGEVHFQEAFNEAEGSKFQRVFQHLKADDEYHAQRLKDYLASIQ